MNRKSLPYLLVPLIPTLIFVALIFAATREGQHYPQWAVAYLDAPGCNSRQLAVRTVLTGLNPAAVYFLEAVVSSQTERPQDSVVYMDREIRMVGENGTRVWQAYEDDSGGATSGAFPLPRNVVLNFKFILYDAQHLPIYQSRILLADCKIGSVLKVVAGAPFAQDLRINPGQLSRVSVFCKGAGVGVYQLSEDSQVEATLGISAQELAATPDDPDASQLLKTSGEVRLYKRPEGLLQVTAPLGDDKTYTFIWDGCPADVGGLEGYLEQ